jgi:trimethylamine:corrinoid methyltransferase-like protein
VLPAVIKGYDVSRVFIDGGSSINLIYANTLRNMNISLANLMPTDTHFHGITHETPTYPLGKTALDVQFGTVENFRKEKLEFKVIE